MIGVIPEHWNILKLRYFAKIQPSNVDKKSVEDQKTIHLCNYLDVYNHEYIDKNIDFMKATASDSQIINFTLRKGDIIITKDSETPLDIAVPAYVPKSLPGIICGYHLAMIRPHNEIAAGEFIFRAFQSESISNQYSSFSNGLTRYGLKVQAIGNALFPLPPLDEQESIINFLKKKTSEIDALNADKEKIVKLLQEYWQALISEAVTRGLDPNVEMKDSGIEWIGKIPFDWKIEQLRRTFKVINGGTPNTSESMYWGGDIIWLTPNDLSNKGMYIEKSERNLTKEGLDNSSATLIPPNNIIISTRAPIGYVSVVLKEFSTNQGCKSLLRLKPIDIRYYFYYLFAANNYLKSYGQGTTFTELSARNLSRINIIVPSLQEQKKIGDFLDRRIMEMDSIVTNIKNQIEILKDYRQVLISESVTGKIDVRNH